jgi:hypothetical protein
VEDARCEKYGGGESRVVFDVYSYVTDVSIVSSMNTVRQKVGDTQRRDDRMFLDQMGYDVLQVDLQSGEYQTCSNGQNARSTHCMRLAVYLVTVVAQAERCDSVGHGSLCTEASPNQRQREPQVDGRSDHHTLIHQQIRKAYHTLQLIIQPRKRPSA